MIKMASQMQKNEDLLDDFNTSMEERDKRVKDLANMVDLNKDQN